MRKILFIMAMFAFAVAVPGCSSDNVSGTNVSGTWILTMMGFQGEVNSFDMVITQDGKKLDITVTNSEFQAMMLSGTGTLKRSKIKFSLKGSDNPFEFIFEGKVTGKKMEGTREVRMEDDDRGGRGGTVTFLPGPSSAGEEPPGEPTADEIEKQNIWSAVMK